MTRPGPEGTASPYIPLPEGLADPRRTAGSVFDREAALYDRARPGYPTEAVAALLGTCGVSGGSTVVEVGAGTGQLTTRLMASGARIVAVEPGPALAGLLAEKVGANPAVEIEVTRFEDLDRPGASVDVVTAATSFHWIEPAVAYPRAAALLRPGGFLALLTNCHSAGGTHNATDFTAAASRLNADLAPELGSWTFPTAADIAAQASAGGDAAAIWSRVERRLGDPPDLSDLFEPATARTWPWMATYRRDGYLDMLASQSSYALLDPERRSRLLRGIGDLVDRLLGGRVTKEYVTVLVTARRR